MKQRYWFCIYFKIILLKRRNIVKYLSCIYLGLASLWYAGSKLLLLFPRKGMSTGKIKGASFLAGLSPYF